MQRKSRETTRKSQKKKTIHKGLIKGGPLLDAAGIQLLVPDNAPDDVKKLVRTMGVAVQEREVIRTESSASTVRASTGAPVRTMNEEDEEDGLMNECNISAAVFDNFDIDNGQVRGGFFSMEFPYQIICAGMKLYQAGYKKLEFITSPIKMVSKNTNLAKYCALKDGDIDKTWKAWL